MKTTAKKIGLASFVAICILLVLAVPAFAAESDLITQINMGRGGSEETPILIDSADRLTEISTMMETADLKGLLCATAHYKQTKDINLAGRSWKPIGGGDIPFGGQFDGDGKTISGLTRRSGGSYGGLFGNVSNAVLKHINLKNLSIGVTSDTDIIIGGLTGVAQCSEISGCSVYGTISVNAASGGKVSTMIGGIAGIADEATVTGCTFSGNAGTKNMKGPVGGIVGMSLNGGSITNCVTVGNISNTGEEGRVGGIIGWGNGGASVRSCYSSGTVNGSWREGGIAGAIYMGSVVGCYSTCDVINTNCLFSGGVVGRAQGDNGVSSYIVGCYATGRVSSGIQSGGIVSFATDSVVASCAALNPSLTAKRLARRIYTMDDNTVEVENNAAWSGMTLLGKVVIEETNDNGRSLTTRGNALAEELEDVMIDYSSGSVDYVASDYWTFEAGKLPTLKKCGANQPTAIPAWLK